MHLVEVLHRNSSVNVKSNVMSRVVALYHIVINTKHRRPTINEANKRTLYSYIYSIIKKRGCFLYRMNGIANHIHILLDLHPSVSLSNLMLEIKRDSSIWMKQSGFFPEFDGWGKEYAAFTCAYKDRNVLNLRKCIMGQSDMRQSLRCCVSRQDGNGMSMPSVDFTSCCGDGAPLRGAVCNAAIMDTKWTSPQGV